MFSDEARRAVADAVVRARTLDAPVAARLDIVSNAIRNHLTPYADAVDRLIARLQAAGAGGGAPAAGEPMPDFLLPDDNGHLTSLSDLLQNGPAILAFHRGHWCPYCRTNAYALAQVQDRIAAAGGTLAAITPERQAFTRKHKAEAGAAYPVLSDIDNGYALSLNLAIWVGGELRGYLESFGRNLPEFHGNQAWVVPVPATFVIGRDGLVKARFVDPDYRRRMDTEALVQAVAGAV
jgi:peroxiredoxin